jgi:hypothetical protein
VTLMSEEKEQYRPETWDEFVAERPYFPEMMWKWIRLSENLVKASPTQEGDDLGCVSEGENVVQIGKRCHHESAEDRPKFSARSTNGR